jgi:hypothetical protein
VIALAALHATVILTKSGIQYRLKAQARLIDGLGDTGSSAFADDDGTARPRLPATF